ncbi:MAG: WhiB family transcriptional regulator [Actinomycetota bacterium]
MTRARQTEQNATDYTWQERGSCRGVDPELFFPSSEEQAIPAKAICGACPVRLACLAFAIERNERFGIWGGLSERERARLPAAARERIVREAAAAA